MALNKNRAIIVFYYCNGFSLEEDIFLIVEFCLKAVQAVTLGFRALKDKCCFSFFFLNILQYKRYTVLES